MSRNCYCERTRRGEISFTVSFSISSSQVAADGSSRLGSNGGAVRTERHSSLPIPSIYITTSQSSLRPKISSSSVETGAMRISAYRRALLRPSVTPLRPVNLALASSIQGNRKANGYGNLRESHNCHKKPYSCTSISSIIGGIGQIVNDSRRFESAKSTAATETGPPSSAATVNVLYFRDSCCAIVPSIQYYIADFNHYAILGNMFFFDMLILLSSLYFLLGLLVFS